MPGKEDDKYPMIIITIKDKISQCRKQGRDNPTKIHKVLLVRILFNRKADILCGLPITTTFIKSSSRVISDKTVISLFCYYFISGIKSHTVIASRESIPEGSTEVFQWKKCHGRS